jgi:hypothetical protein
VTKPLLRRKKVKLGKDDPIWVSLKYEKLPTFCYHCDILGHSERECRETEKMGRDNGGNTKAYGPWLRASLGRWKPATTTITGGRSDSLGKNPGTSAPHTAPSQAETSVTGTKEKVTADEALATITEKVTGESQNQGPIKSTTLMSTPLMMELWRKMVQQLRWRQLIVKRLMRVIKKSKWKKKKKKKKITELAPNKRTGYRGNYGGNYETCSK